MVSRLDKAFYVIVAAGYLLPFILLPLFRYSLSVPSIVGELFLSGVFWYAAFWGFSIGEGLKLKIYRRQALLVGLAGAFFAGQWLVQAVFDPFYPYGSGLGYLIVDLYDDFGFMMIFGWIDTSIPLLQRSDRFVRDPLRWKKLRYPLWALVVSGAIGTTLVFPRLINNQLLSGVFTSTQYPAIFLGAVALWLGIRRGNDRVLEKHLKWFGGSAMVIILAFLFGHFSHGLQFLPPSGGIFVQAIQYTLLTIAGVFLFRSARDLVPLSPILSESLIEAQVK